MSEVEIELTRRQKLRRLLTRINHFFTPPRRIWPTTFGKIYFLAVLLLGAAAMNTGNNLLYLILGMTLAFIAASGVLSELSIQRLELQRKLPKNIFAGREFRYQLLVNSNKKRFTSYALTFRDELAPGCQATFFSFVIQAGDVASLSALATAPRRGRFRSGVVEVSTTFPFRILRKWYPKPLPSDFIVYPEIFAVNIIDPHADSGRGERNIPRKGDGAELHSIRPWLAGDPKRSIHWRSSAKAGQLLAKIQQAESEEAWLLDITAADFLADVSTFEESVSLFASAAHALINEGKTVGLQAGSLSVALGRGNEQKQRLLSALALIDKEQARQKNPLVFPTQVLRLQSRQIKRAMKQARAA